MQETINKLKTYFGFCIKSNSILFGSDNILKTRKNLDVVIFCNSATEKHIYPILNKGLKCVKLTNVTFKKQTGWYISHNSSGYDGDAVNVLSFTSNAKYLKDTYCNYYWHRK